MSQITPARVVLDHLALTPQARPDRKVKLGLFVALAAASVVVGLTVGIAGIRTNGIAGLLTATSIMTGLVFTMAMRFWERSLDARSDPDMIFDHKRRNTTDDMRTLLLWTVFAGMVSTAWLGALAIVVGTQHADAWATGVAAGLVTYQLLYVGRSLVSLYSASYTLRR